MRVFLIYDFPFILYLLYMDLSKHIDILEQFTRPHRSRFNWAPEDNPRLFFPKEFCETVGQILDADGNLYRVSEIDKWNGKKRIIEAPSDEPSVPLRQVQRIIHRSLSPLDNGRSSHAFRMWKSAYSGIVQMGARMSSPHNPNGIQSMYALDVKNFFPSVDETMIRKEIGTVLERILVNYPKWPKLSKEEFNNLIDILVILCTYEWRLPQWAPSSPTIANMVANKIDGRVRYALEDTMWLWKTSVYGRYADDMVIFSGTHLSQSQRKTIRQIVQDFWLTLAHEKSHYEEWKWSYSLWWVEIINGKTQNNTPNITFRISPERDREYAAKILELSQKLKSETIKDPNEKAKIINQVLGTLGFVFHISVLWDGDRIIGKIREWKKWYFLSDRCEHAWRIFLAHHENLMHPNCRSWFTEKEYVESPFLYKNFQEKVIHQKNGWKFEFEWFFTKS